MTQVCFVGDPEVNLRYELLSRETARNALQTYDLGTPFHNTVGVETVSLGAAVALVNDLNWYIVRFVDTVIVKEPSVSESEWLSRDLATAIRDDEVDPAETGRFLMVYGVQESHGFETPDPGEAGPSADAAGEGGEGATGDGDVEGDDAGDSAGEPPVVGAGGAGGVTGVGQDDPPRLVEPMFVTRTGETIPEYDLRDVDRTLVVRVTEDEFGA